MNFEELFRDYWWLIFPFFGMGMAVLGATQEERKAKSAMQLLKSYVDQGKEPPPELLRLALHSEEGAAEQSGKSNSRAWTFVTFAALTAGFGVGWYLLEDADVGFAFATVTVTMGVLAIGALFILLFGRK
jgi:hypothetical protein